MWAIGPCFLSAAGEPSAWRQKLFFGLSVPSGAIGKSDMRPRKSRSGVARAALRAARAVRGLLPRLAPESGRPRAGGAGARAGAAAEVAQAPEGEGEHGADEEWGGKRLR